MAMILAGATLLCYAQGSEVNRVSQAIYESVFEAVNDGNCTVDLGGRSSTTEFTDDVVRRVQEKLTYTESFSTLATAA